MLPHSLFSLPYGIVAILFSGSRNPWLILAVLVALFSARSAANAFNRLCDRKFDLLNHRTADRILPSGRINTGFAVVSVIMSVAVLFLSVLFTRPICVLLLPFAIIFCLFYSFQKRFCALCHFYLGAACGLSVLGPFIALTNTLNLPIILLFLALLLQVAGFDILYSVSDIEFDRKYGLCSVPARYGEVKARQIAAYTFLGSNLFLALFVLFSSAGPFTALAVAFISIIMQTAVKSASSLNLNGICSVLFLVLFCIDLI